ncbi:uncharacterized protein PRCAT00001989001 [Priceomyces carsonii]|uniref:uncharacterized protein n=1 Tax=Priceomyces carsonii TaxID=28549 RepID=UPI002ED86F50|nr:unnamed protein product [Priceomyces carsonii]
MIIRFRSKDGMFRISTEPKDDFLNLLGELVKKLKTNDGSSIYVSESPGAKGQQASSLCGKSIDELGLKNGDMLFVTYESDGSKDNEKSDINSVSGSIGISASSMLPQNVSKIKQLPVDNELDKKDGYIKRPRSRFCRHGDKGMCEYCAPLPPWDKEYRKEHGLKHMSFHAYLDELNDHKNNKNNATSYIAPLENLNYNVNLNCPSMHAPYPKGICSKCQPPVITLQQQQFRMVDHVEFADSQLLNKFIDTWRQTGVQRFGILYGTYETFDKAPLGIRAVVQAIYEPPQADEADGITLLEWENEEQVDSVAFSLGLYKVGVIFTDLTDSGVGDGTVLCKRHKSTYFLSGLEVMMAARNQVKYPNHTNHANSGYFSSKFVTCVVSGGLKGEIEPRSYQVSTNAEALVKADIITASTQPSMMYINNTDSKRYVPDIFYLKINEYGLEVKTNAKPAFPVEYLLVTLLDSFPLEPKPLFSSDFIIENRDFMGDVQDLSAAYKYLSNDASGDGSRLRDFHFLIYVERMGILEKHELSLLLKFVRDKDYETYLQLVESPGWMTFIIILEQSS